MLHCTRRTLSRGALFGAALLPAAATAIDWNVTGSVRQEIGIGIASGENEFNQNGNPFNARSVPVLTNNPLNGALLRSDGLRADANTAPVPTTCKFSTQVACRRTHARDEREARRLALAQVARGLRARLAAGSEPADPPTSPDSAVERELPVEHVGLTPESDERLPAPAATH